MNALDRLIAWVSPRSGAERARNRLAIKSYEAATTGRRLSGRGRESGSANDVIGNSAPAIAYAARNLVRNNAWAARGLSAVVTNTIGSGIVASVVNPNKARATRVKREFDRWAASRIDDINRLDFYGAQALVHRTMVESGECFVRRVTRADLVVPLGIVVLEPDWLDTTKGTLGIEYSTEGKPTGYWMYASAPSSVSDYGLRNSILIPASDVIHVYRVDRPGQRRGVSWFAPITIDLHDFDGYEDAVLLRAKMAACKVDYVIAPESITQSWSVTDRQEPGATEIVPYGTEVKSTPAPDSGDYVPFAKQRLRRIAAGLGLSYEALTGDLSETNFSSGRMGWLEMQRTIEHSRWHVHIPQFCDGIAAWWAERAVQAGIDARETTWRWTPPRREVVDPSREYPAMRDAMRAGIFALPEVHRSLGYETADVLAEIDATNKELDRLGIKIDSDARNTQSQAPAAPTA